MSDPGLPGASVGKRIGVGNVFVLGDVLPSFEMPPDIRIGDVARGHREEAEEQHCQEDMGCGEQPVHGVFHHSGSFITRYDCQVQLTRYNRDPQWVPTKISSCRQEGSGAAGDWCASLWRQCSA